jgi:hypothetical protein
LIEEGREIEMSAKKTLIAVIAAFGLLTVSLLAPNRSFAHCDGLDGPVVQAAQQALQTNNVNLVLIWVAKDDEPEIIKAFQKAIAVRKLDPQAKELADLYFFETCFAYIGPEKANLTPGSNRRDAIWGRQFRRQTRL